MEGREFKLSAEQMQQYNEWRKEKKKTLPQATIGGAYTFCFTPTGLGDFVEVTCVDGTKLDLTEYDLL